MKKHIPNPEVFESYDNKWEDVVEVDGEVTASLETVDLIKDEKGLNVYKIEGSTKKLIKSPEAFDRNKFNWTKIAPVNDVELDAFADGGVIE